jgi:aryl-alcohol dehydrogenase-like predicted oxidoreductase
MDLRAFMDEMAAVRQKGKTRHIGVSNFQRDQVDVAVEYGIVSLQPPYNVLWREIEGDVLPFCRENDVGVTPYSPLAQGLLTGRFTRESEPLTGIRRKNTLFEEPIFSKAREAARAVDEVADEHGATSSQVALAWLLATPGVTAPIVGISRWGHWQDNAGALDLELSDADYERISAAGLSAWEEVPEGATMWGWRPQ